MAQLIRDERRAMYIYALVWLVLSAVGWSFLVPWFIQRYYTVEAFVTNNRQDGPPKINITDGPLIHGEDGSPRVHPDWLVRKGFRDYRTVFVYKDNALGAPVCAPFNHDEPDGGYNDRAGAVQPEVGYSLDRWAGGKLDRCEIPPGRYVVVTEYRVPVLAGLSHVTFEFTSNVFEVTEPPVAP
jgi:hypothetical protein